MQMCKEQDSQQQMDRGDSTVCVRCSKPTCWIRNIGRQHWAYCEGCHLKFVVGENLFSSWREQTEEEWKKNWEFLKDFEDLTVY